MKALIFRNIGDIALEDVPDPVIIDQTDAIVRITTSAICGTDLHFIRGTIPGMRPGTILGHEGVGIIEEIGSEVKNFKIGDRVIIPSTIACGHCRYCDKKIYSQCDNANPNGPDAGTAFYGGPAHSGPFNGLQAEKARIPFADTSFIKLPSTISDDQAILLSDILPTAYMAVEMAEVQKSDTVAVFGCGPVGQLVIACLKLQGVKNIIAIDRVESRLIKAQEQGCHVINFDNEDPVVAIKKMTQGIGADKVIDAVGVDADHAQCCGLEYKKAISNAEEFKKELHDIAPQANPHDGNWYPGSGPSQVLQWLLKAVAKAGRISIIGVYPIELHYFSIGYVVGRNLTIKAGNCNHRAYIPKLLEQVEQGIFNLDSFISHKVMFNDIEDAYKNFDARSDGWIKVALHMKN